MKKSREAVYNTTGQQLPPINIFEDIEFGGFRKSYDKRCQE
jgi:hypothetical protein